MPRVATRVLTLVLVVLPAAAAPARAEWHLTPFIGQTFGSSFTLPDLEQAADKAHWHFGGAVAVLGEGPLGLEGVFLFTPSFFQREGLGLVSSSYQMALMGNVVIAAPRSWNEYGLRPFVSGGLGLLRSAMDEQTQVFSFRLNGLGYNVGGGAVGFLTNQTGLRFDVRYFRLQPRDFGLAVGDRANLSFWTASVGVVIRP
ncbi:MAG TPA: outer membrane beta-barrel protein [Vicinamibacterales bacterium]|nr:outer membrane beta-barrel protein [Vicinamibacterales bacterium]